MLWRKAKARAEALCAKAPIDIGASSNKVTGKFQFWQNGNHPIELWSDEVFYPKMDYIHLNPVANGFVAQCEDWLYSSARDHAGLPGLINLVAN